MRQIRPACNSNSLVDTTSFNNRSSPIISPLITLITADFFKKSNWYVSWQSVPAASCRNY